MITTRRADQLRLACNHPVLGAPPFISVVRVTNIFRPRWDVQIRWLSQNGWPDECWVHTSARGPAGALRRVIAVAHFVAPGRRFDAAYPWHAVGVHAVGVDGEVS